MPVSRWWTPRYAQVALVESGWQPNYERPHHTGWHSSDAVRSISRKWSKRAAIAGRCCLHVVNEAACEFNANYVVPQMVVRSSCLRLRKIVFSDAKRLLQSITLRTDKCFGGVEIDGQFQPGWLFNS